MAKYTSDSLQTFQSYPFIGIEVEAVKHAADDLRTMMLKHALRIFAALPDIGLTRRNR
ncbi:hypothetical protein [Rhodopila sp.]|uniref:hypothetical protein n=1 Tax=Rhodopila sp. TaxID=2480087 RepID=UPI003D0F61F2